MLGDNRQEVFRILQSLVVNDIASISGEEDEDIDEELDLLYSLDNFCDDIKAIIFPLC